MKNESLIEIAYSAYTLGVFDPKDRLENVLLGIWNKVLQLEIDQEKRDSLAGTISNFWQSYGLSEIDSQKVDKVREIINSLPVSGFKEVTMVNHRAFLGMPEPGNKKVSRRKFDQFLKKRRNEFIENKNQP